jgi:hypothetical protein
MTLVMPDGVPVLGATAVKAVVTIADPTAPSLATEINAVTSKDISLHLSGSGWSPGGTTNKGTKPARLGSKTQAEQFNRTTFTLGTLQYVFDPQGDDTDAVNAAKALLVEGTKIHLLERLGLDAETDAWAAGQKTVDHHVELGPQIKGPADRSDENAEFVIMQDVIYVSGAGPVDGVIAA